MDDVDRQIIAHLRFHGRDSYRQLAAKLQLHPSTVIKRVQRMEKDGLLTCFGANVDYLKMGYEFMALVDIRATKGRIPDVSEKLRHHAGVAAVWDITGQEDMVALIVCKTRAEFNRVIKHLGAIPHVERTITHVILDVIKNEWEFVPQ
ncbi:MAG: Lrp/AsnC family transcriptional regulator [Candidatus Micrarchaeota archaeon]|nr:Lrp/AsnC family transcriptional regulator [Candidatus Micrarchaeota archaeon]